MPTLHSFMVKNIAVNFLIVGIFEQFISSQTFFFSC